MTLKQGVLHHLYIATNVESHRLVLPSVSHQAVFQMLHGDYGHQGLGLHFSYT